MPNKNTPGPLGPEIISSRVKQCPSLPSLDCNARDMIRLLNAGQTFTSQICDVVQRDPSLTARVLRMVNSVYFGLAEPVTTVEQAVFFVFLLIKRKPELVSKIVRTSLKV